MEQAGLGNLVDAQALAAYRRRLAEIDTELDEADTWGKAIATALDAIHGADPVVARHLTTRVRTGLVLLRARPGRPGRVAAVYAGVLVI